MKFGRLVVIAHVGILTRGVIGQIGIVLPGVIVIGQIEIVPPGVIEIGSRV